MTKLAVPRNGSGAAVEPGQRDWNEPRVCMAMQGSESVLDVSPEATLGMLTHPSAGIVDAGGALWVPNKR